MNKSEDIFLQDALKYLQKAAKLLEGIKFMSGNVNFQKQIDKIKQVITELQKS